MTATMEAIVHAVLDLPNDQRLALARIILDLDGGPADEDAEAAWDDVIEARLKAYEEGKLETVSWEEVKRDIESRLREQPDPQTS